MIIYDYIGFVKYAIRASLTQLTETEARPTWF